MALPNSNITTGMVRNDIGESTNNVGALLISPLVNPVGFNSPSNIQNNTYWGKTPTERNAVGRFELGAFRGYDHNWIAFTLGGISRITEDYFGPVGIRITIPLAFAQLETKPFVNVNHNFTVQFSRTNNFHQGGGFNITEGVDINRSSPYFDIFFSSSNPPDGGSALLQEQTFYINVIHNSSPDKRWFIHGQSAGSAASGGDNYITSLTIPIDPYTGSIYHETSANAYHDAQGTGAKLYNVTISIKSDTRSSGNYGVTVAVANNPSFTNESTLYKSIPYISNSTPGTAQVNGSETFDFSDLQKNRLNAGDTMYYRTKVGTNAWSMTMQKVVIDGTPPME